MLACLISHLCAQGRVLATVSIACHRLDAQLDPQISLTHWFLDTLVLVTRLAAAASILQAPCWIGTVVIALRFAATSVNVLATLDNSQTQVALLATVELSHLGAKSSVASADILAYTPVNTKPGTTTDAVACTYIWVS